MTLVEALRVMTMGIPVARNLLSQGYKDKDVQVRVRHLHCDLRQQGYQGPRYTKRRVSVNDIIK